MIKLTGKERKKEYCRKYRLEHKKEIKAYRKKYNLEHKQENKESSKRYRNTSKFKERIKKRQSGPKYKEYQKNYKLFYKYGITIDIYNDLLNKQNHACKICKKTQLESKEVLHVDHNHKTGDIRGLLCRDCNLILGFARDDKTILKAAIEYLK